MKLFITIHIVSNHYIIWKKNTEEVLQILKYVNFIRLTYYKNCIHNDINYIMLIVAKFKKIL